MASKHLLVLSGADACDNHGSMQGAEVGGHFEFTPPLRGSQDDMAAETVSATVSAHSEYSPLPSGGTPSPVSTHTTQRTQRNARTPNLGCGVVKLRHSLASVATVSVSVSAE